MVTGTKPAEGGEITADEAAALDWAREWRRTGTGYRLPEPTRLAHVASNRFRSAGIGAGC